MRPTHASSMYRVRRMRRLRQIAIGLAVGLTACSAAVDDGKLADRPDAGASASSDGGAPQIRSTMLREDFETRELVERSVDAIVDVNAGIVTLPAETFPDVEADSLETLA